MKKRAQRKGAEASDSLGPIGNLVSLLTDSFADLKALLGPSAFLGSSDEESAGQVFRRLIQEAGWVS